ncbi:hypothetical protein MMC10_001981 [Thelotrema lepadinum]|nr:hypothetical protein [Thelotrema lepadinum]
MQTLGTLSLVLASAYAVAQTSAASSDADDWLTVTEYTDDCSTWSGSGWTGISYTGTEVDTVTDTLGCDECEHKTTSKPGIWTTYTTAYVETCSTGETSKTYTITESCSEENQPRPSSYVPSGFTVTTVTCDACEHPTVTLTTPCEQATEGTKPAPTPAPSAPATTPAAPATTAPPAPGPTTAPAALPSTAPAPSAPAGKAPPSPPAGTPAAHPPNYVAMNTSTVVCHNCKANTTSPPIHIAAASSMTSFTSFVVAMWATIASLFIAL